MSLASLLLDARLQVSIARNHAEGELVCFYQVVLRDAHEANSLTLGASLIGGYQDHNFSISPPDLFMRWTQFGCFTPIMQMHRQVKASRQYPWSYGDQALANYRSFAALHTRAIAGQRRPTLRALRRLDRRSVWRQFRRVEVGDPP